MFCSSFCTLKKKGGGGNITFSLNFLAEESCPGCRVCSASCLKEVEEVRDNSMCVTSEQKPGPVHLVPCSGTLSTGEKHHLLAWCFEKGQAPKLEGLSSHRLPFWHPQPRIEMKSCLTVRWILPMYRVRQRTNQNLTGKSGYGPNSLVSMKNACFIVCINEGE